MTDFFFPKQERTEALKASGQTSFDTETIALQGVAIIAAAIEGIYGKPVYSGAYGLQAIVDGIRGKESLGTEALKALGKKANPFFIANSVKALKADSPVTQSYLTSRRWKNVGGSTVQIIGDLASLAAPPANVPSAVYHGQAAALTGAHMFRLAAIAHQYRNAAQVADWCKLIYSLKTMKLGIRGGQLVGAIVPAASMPASIAAAVMTAGIRLTFTGACYAAAAQIHWIAYKEQGHYPEPVVPTAPTTGRAAITRPSPAGAPINYSRPLPSAPINYSRPLPSVPPLAGNRQLPPQKPVPTGPLPSLPPLVPNRRPPTPVEGPEAGPASTIMWEIFTKRGATRLFGTYDIAALVKEPAGWMALGDKLMLL